MADEGGFHHDGEAYVLSLEHEVVETTPVRLFVNVSQHAQAGEDQEPSLVEVQNERETLFLLTSAECLELSLALLRAADQVAEERTSADAALRELRAFLGKISDGVEPMERAP